MINWKKAKEKCRMKEIIKIENFYEALNDDSQVWHLHHRLELTLNGEHANSKDNLIRFGMYYNRPYFELIFLRESEHKSLHHKNKEISKETKQKISLKLTGNKLSNETKLKLSKIALNRPISEFGNGYYEHYGYLGTENINQYKREHKYWTKHNKFSWE